MNLTFINNMMIMMMMMCPSPCICSDTPSLLCPWTAAIMSEPAARAAPVVWRKTGPPASDHHRVLLPCWPGHTPEDNHSVVWQTASPMVIYQSKYEGQRHQITSNKCCNGFCFNFSWDPNRSKAAPNKPVSQKIKHVLFYMTSNVKQFHLEPVGY